MELPQLKDRGDNVLRFAFAVFVAIGCIMVIWPFATAISVAGVIAIVTWNPFKRIRKSCGGSNTVASLVMVCLLAVLIVIPLTGLSLVAAQQIPVLIGVIRKWIDSGFAIPIQIQDIPLIGGWLHEELLSFVSGEADLIPVAQKIFDPISRGLLKVAVMLGDGMLQLIIVLFVIFFFYRDGEYISRKSLDFLTRMSGDLAEEVQRIIVRTTRSVVFGIVGSAAGQGLVAYIGFWICGIPHAAILSIAVFVLAPVPVGPPMIWIPASIWLLYQDEIGFGIFLILWGLLAVASVDNFLKPVLISKQGAPLPMALIYLGVFGGVIAFGFMGIILGPVALAVGIAMSRVWLSTARKAEVQEAEAQLAKEEQDTQD